MQSRRQKRSTQLAARIGSVARNVAVGCAITIVALRPAASATSPPPLDLSTLLDGAACHGAAGGVGITLGDEVARGLLAFNTPYLFGGRALRTDLTCGACHGPSAPSGAAALLRFRVPVPDLARAFANGTDVAAFVSHAVVTEFSGPPAPPGVARSLAALARVLVPRTARGIPDACRIDATRLVDVGLRLSLYELRQSAPDEAAFTIDSTRFVLGQIYLTAESGEQPVGVILSINGLLRDASAAIEAGTRVEAAQRLSHAAAVWEAALMSGQGPPIAIYAEAQ